MPTEHFIYIIRPVKEDFQSRSTEEEDKIVAEHFQYLKSLHEEKVLILAGRETNAKFGIVVFEAESEAKAREIMDNDPAVINKVFAAELHPFRVSLLRA